MQMDTLARTFAALLLGSLGACSGGTKPPTVQATGRSPCPAPLSVQLQVPSEPDAPEPWRSIPEGGVVADGTELRVKVFVDRDVHLLVERRPAYGPEQSLLAAAERVAPGEHATPLTPVGGAPGTESILVVAAGQPLAAEALGALKQELQQADKGERACVRTRDPPPGSGRDRPGDSLCRADFNQGGVAALRFTFVHQ